MSFVGGGFGPGGGPAAARPGVTRGRMGGSPMYGVNYPSPFFDVAHTYLPTTVKQMFRWCRYYFLTNPLINATVFKMAEYPITDLVIDHPSKEVVKRWTEYLQEHLHYRSWQSEVGLDYYCYGNSMVSIGFPFQKTLTCQQCGFNAPASKIRANWNFSNYAFRMVCPECAYTGDAIQKDVYLKNASGIKLIRWSCEDVEVTYNDVTGEATYFYTIPATVRNDLVLGKKDIVEKTPQIFIQALKEQKAIVFSADNFMHLKRPSLANQDRGWGTPLLLPVLKDTFYLQIMKKAQEAILLEHIVPLRILFPQAGSGSSDPYTTINLVDWRDHVAREIAQWRLDNNYIPILPLPIGNQTIGGDGKALLMTGEIQEWSRQILAGLQVPQEFIYGGLSYAGTNVSMRMMENMFLGYIGRHRQLLKFVMKTIAAYMDWPEVNIRFKPFKMADDIQRKAYIFQLNQAGKLSDTTLLADADFSQEEENEIMQRETASRIAATKDQQLAMAEVQGEQSLIMAKYQTRAQQAQQQALMTGPAPGEAGGADAMGGGAPGGQEAEGTGMSAQGPQAPAQAAPGMAAGPPQEAQSPLNGGQRLGGQPGMDLPSMAWFQAQTIAGMPPDQQGMAVNNLEMQSPELAQLVTQMLKQLGVKLGPSTAGQPPAVDMRPMPEVKPPRRASAG